MPPKKFDSAPDMSKVSKDEDEAGVKGDTTQVQGAFGVSNMEDVEELERKKLDKALAAIKVNKDDVKLIANELMMDNQSAKRALKRNSGDAAATLKALVEGA